MEKGGGVSIQITENKKWAGCLGKFKYTKTTDFPSIQQQNRVDSKLQFNGTLTSNKTKIKVKLIKL